MKYVLDASAVLAYLRDESGAERMESVFAESAADIAMHSVNLLEVYYKLASYGGEAAAKEALDDIAALGVKTSETLDGSMRLRAGFYKIRYPFLSLADAICIAFAAQSRAVVLTTDRPFANIREDAAISLIR